MSRKPTRIKRAGKRAENSAAKRLHLAHLELEATRALAQDEDSPNDSDSSVPIIDSDTSDRTEGGSCSDSATSSDHSVIASDHSIIEAPSPQSSADDAPEENSLYVSVHEDVAQGELLTDEAKEGYLRQSLKEWAMRGVSTKKIDDLLKKLKVVHPSLPASFKTLLQTPRKVPVERMGTGEFWYKGIATNITERLSEENLQMLAGEPLEIDINIDGIDLYEKGKDGKMWPILGSFVGFSEEEVFIIGVYCGKKKPDNVSEFLRQYAEEVELLEREGMIVGEHTYGVVINNYILDAPARSMVKSVIGHNGEKACEKCMVKGKRVLGREVYCDCDAPLRTDANFRDRSDPRHHVNVENPLEEIGTGMVSQFRLDAMHLVDLGVFKRFLEFLLGRKPKLPAPLSPQPVWKFMYSNIYRD